MQPCAVGLTLPSRPGRPAPSAQPQTWRRALEENLAPETHKPSRSAAGFGADPTGFFDQTLVLDQPSEILLMQPYSGKRLDRALQLQQSE